jgi:sec-independent protein translocase protein TatB
VFEVGFTEILLILGLALLVLGPEKLPGLAEKIGRWTGRARAMARQLRTQLEQEVNLEEMAKARTDPPASPPPPESSSSPGPSSSSEPSSSETQPDAPSPQPAEPEIDYDKMMEGAEIPGRNPLHDAPEDSGASKAAR